MDNLPEEIAAIYQQVGGGRAMAMAFYAMVYNPDEPSATFAVAPALRRGTRDRIIKVRVRYVRGSDTYRVEFFRRDDQCVSSHDDVHAAELRPLIERTTGLHLSMGTMGARS